MPIRVRSSDLDLELKQIFQNEFVFLVRSHHPILKIKSKLTVLSLTVVMNILGVFMTSKIYVGNLGYSVENTMLADKFAQFGTVESAKVIMDRDTNRSKGFGFVEMSSPSEAAAAISELNGTDFGGRQINVTEAKPMAPRDNNSRRY